MARRAAPFVMLVSIAFAFAPLNPSRSGAAPHAPLRMAPHEVRRTPRALSFAPGEVVAIANPGVLEAGIENAPLARDARLAGLLANLGVDRARVVGPAAGPDTKRRERIWLLASRRPGFDPIQAARALQATGAFRAVSPNYRFGLFNTTPNDLYLFNQWYVDDGGFADIRLPHAWDLERGDSSVVIAIMDTGVDTSHPDFASKIWHNPGEIPGNGVDDDGNGLVDDDEGWDFGTGDKDPKPEYTADPSGIDVGFHGTFCAGVAAAATNNDEGIAGATWKCQIMPLKVSHPDSGLTSSAIAGAFAYATDKHASVISMSFGGPGDPGVPEFFQALVDMATSAGAICVAAAGNDDDSVRVYPAACDRVLAVGATDYNNARAEFSNFGSWVDVAAPGASMFSTISQNYTFSDIDQIIYWFYFGWDLQNPYMWGDGTSFACPLVAGVCGLVRAHFPYLTPALVAKQVTTTGDAVAYDFPIGKRVNAYQAVTSVPTAVAAEARAPGFGLEAAPNPTSGLATIRFVLPAEQWARLTLFDSRGRRVRTLAEGVLPAGPHAIVWDGVGDRGRVLPASIYFARLESGDTVLKMKLVWMGG